MYQQDSSVNTDNLFDEVSKVNTFLNLYSSEIKNAKHLVVTAMGGIF